MNRKDIRFQIDNNNQKIRELMDKFDFTLNDELNKLLQANDDLRAQCDHEFVDGFCKWCDEFQGDEENLDD